MTRTASSCALLVVAAVTSAALTGCSDSDVEPGDVLEARGGLTGTALSVRVPTGLLTVTVGRPAGALDGSEAADGSVDGGGEVTFVGISAELDDGAAGAGLPPQAYLWVADPPSQPDLTLVVGDRSYDLGGDPLTGPSYVAVEGGDVEGSDLRVEVTFDGVTQTADVGTGDVDHGDAAALYDDPAPLRRGLCTGGRFDGPVATADVSCRVTIGQLPFVAEAGWAPDGGTWNVVETSVDVTGARDRAGAALPAGPVERVDEPEPVAVLGTESGPGSLTDVRVLDGSADPEAVVVRVGTGDAASLYRSEVTER